MRQWFLIIISLIIVLSGSKHSLAQNGTSATAGDPPIAALISISQPDEAGIVTITGAPGAVFPGAQVAVRNLYTSEVVYVPAGITGSFTASLFGPGNTPFQISPAPSIPADRRDQPGSLPGGPATIIYGAFPEARSTDPIPVTQLVVDGNAADWEEYPDSSAGDVFALRNTDSLFIGTSALPEEFTAVRVRLLSGTAEIDVSVSPGLYETGLLQENAPTERDPVTVAAVAEVGEALEIRIPLASLDNITTVDIETLALAQLAFLDTDATVLEAVDLPEVTIVSVVEQDGIVYPESILGEDFTPFSVSGSVAQGASVWHARGRVESLDYAPGDTLDIEMDVRLSAPELAETLAGLNVIGQFGLLPVAGANNNPVSGAQYGNNGWSTLQTESGLAIENLSANLFLAEIVVPPSRIIRKGDDLLFGFSAELALPDDLPAGTYVPYFLGLGQIGDGERFTWVSNGPLGTGEQASIAVQRLPLVLNIGVDSAAPRRLIWTLFHDESGNGSRGIIAQEDRDITAISNRVKFNSPTYILPPSTRYDDETVTYSIEPYIINMLPNTYFESTAPLLPLLFPNGRIDAVINRPDGTSDSISGTPIVQNALGTDALDEQTLFGEQSQVDIYRLTTLNDQYTNQTFDVYGDYSIELTGFVEDVWGNRYEGGGTYEFTVAETLNLSPSMLPGTSLEAGNSINAGLHVSPGIPADVTVTVRIFPLRSDQVLEQTFEGQANRFGLFQPETPFLLEVPGEYVIDYEARYTDADGRLWAGSLRSAGVIGQRGNFIVAHGQRGIANTDTDTAWFLAGETGEGAVIHAPYFSGDIAWLPDSPSAGLLPQIHLEDNDGTYTEWLSSTHDSYTAPDGTSLTRLQAEDSLPLAVLADTEDNDARVLYDPEAITNHAYSYFSYVTPGNSLRQLVLGREGGEIPLTMQLNDPLNGQVGAGSEGLLPGDYIFLFGGTVLKNSELNIEGTAIHGSLGVVISPEDEAGARVLPPLRGTRTASGDSTLFEINETDVDIFFHPTGARPGDVLLVGDTLAITGQVAPLLAADVSVQITSPTGQEFSFDGTANKVGYFYEPIQDIVIEEYGVWQVQVTVQHTGRTSAGIPDENVPGTVPGVFDASYNVYVLPGADNVLERPQAIPVDTRIPPGSPFNFSFDPPVGWTDVGAYLTVTLPGQVIQDNTLTLQGNSIIYQFNPTTLNQQVPSYEGNNGRVSGEASSDPLTLTLVVTGVNENGVADIIARRMVIRHDRLITLD